MDDAIRKRGGFRRDRYLFVHAMARLDGVIRRVGNTTFQAHLELFQTARAAAHAHCSRAKAAWMAGQGVDAIWEVGAGKALSGMVRRIERSIACTAIGTPEDVQRAVASLA